MRRPSFSSLAAGLAAAGLAAAAVAASGCGPRAANEQQYWTNHQRDVAEYGGRWPGWKPLLEARLQRATPMWEAALKVGDEKQKAEKMKEANGALADGLFTRLEEVKYKSQGIESTIGKINELKLPLSAFDERGKAVAAARGAIAEVERAMVAAHPATEADAEKILAEQIGKLIDASSDADRAYRGLKPEPEKKDKKDKDKDKDKDKPGGGFKLKKR